MNQSPTTPPSGSPPEPSAFSFKYLCDASVAVGETHEGTAKYFYGLYLDSADRAELATARAALAQCEERARKDVSFLKTELTQANYSTDKWLVRAESAEAKLAQCEENLRKERREAGGMTEQERKVWDAGTELEEKHGATLASGSLRGVSQNAIIADLTARLASATQQLATAEAALQSIKMPSNEWLRQDKYSGLLIMDADGWDRSAFENSWAERITQSEFERRAAKSTCRWPRSLLDAAMKGTP